MAFSNTFSGFGGGGGANSGFGNTSSIFGSTTQPAATTPSSGGLFGSSTTQQTGGFNSTFSFGQSTAAPQVVNGTTIKFNPVTGTDTLQKNGQPTNINTLHQCITAMKEYESKSLEELRYEDYAAKRKFPQQQTTMGGFSSPSVFGSSTPAATTQNIFSPSVGSTSLFGANKPATSLFGSTPTSTTSNIFGSTGTAATTAGTNRPLFGGTGFGGFGTTTTQAAATPSTNIFGSTTAKPSIFSTSTQQPATTSLFGAQTSTPSTGLFGQSTGFGSTASTATTGTGIFGQQKPSAFGAFGQPAATTASTSAFSFGAPTTTNPLFSASPATTTAAKPTGFGSPFGGTSFGTTTTAGTTSNIFGSGANQTASKPLFGISSTTTGFGAPTTSTASPFSGFGTTQTTPQPASTAFNFGFNAPTSTSASQPTSAFGSTTQPSFAGFGSMTGSGLTQSTQPSLFGGAQNTSLTGGGGVSTLGGSGMNQLTSPSQQQQPYMQQQLMALVNAPYGTSPLFRNIIQDFNKKEDVLKPINPLAQKTFMSDTTNIMRGGLSQTVKVTPKALTISSVTKASNLFEGLEDEEEVPCFVPRKNIKKLMFKKEGSRRSSTSNSINSDKIDFLSESQQQMFATNKNKEKAPVYLDDSVKYQMTNDYTNISEDGADNVQHNGNHNRYELEIEDIDAHLKNHHPAGIILERPDYHTVPSLEDLANTTDEKGNCLVENFTIVRVNYGFIVFPGITNVANLNLDEIVQIKRKEVYVYTDESKKPPIGQGLNRPAEVTLHGVWPTDKHTKKAIMDPQRLLEMKYSEKVEKLTLEMGAEFVDYEMETGSWTFKVDHFSKYGINDSDDEEDNTSAYKTTSKDDMMRKQLNLVEKRRLELAKKVKFTSTKFEKPKKSFNMNNINLDMSEDEDESDRASTYSNKENQLYPDLKQFKVKSQQQQIRKIYPNLNIIESELSKENFINNLDFEDKEQFMHEEKLVSTTNAGLTSIFTNDEYDEDKFNLEKDNEYPTTTLIHERQLVDDYESGMRNKKLLNAFFNEDVDENAEIRSTTNESIFIIHQQQKNS